MFKKFNRFPYKYIIVVLIVTLLLYYLFGDACMAVCTQKLNNMKPYVSSEKIFSVGDEAIKVTASNLNRSCIKKNVEVNVNNLRHFKGVYMDNEVYVPFTFLQEYYELFGSFNDELNSSSEETADLLKFNWRLTDPAMLDPQNLDLKNYTTSGIYLNFANTNVSFRSRVKCICGKYEVPITTQWDPKGYYYPIQIAQYGLSHISKYYAGDHPAKNRRIKFDKDRKGRHTIQIDDRNLFVLKLKFKSKVTSVSFEVDIKASNGKDYVLRYCKSKKIISRVGNVIIHDIGDRLTRDQITRDLNVDLMKGLSFVDGKKVGNTVKIDIKLFKSIRFNHVENIKILLLMNVDHVAMFKAAADWFLDFQDVNGGWKVNTSRVIFKGMSCEKGWYSAMGQGQAMSLLSRVYRYTNERKYLDAALKAVKVFRVPSNKNGVLAMLFGKYPWYEEYPVTPPLFVLNGFIFSLFGLYDLYNTAFKKEDKIKPKQLFDEGINTLEVTLPLFDNGHGSFYDLRHVSIPGHPPNRARWQYHRVHLVLLSSLYHVTKSESIDRTLQRWIGYSAGVLARHN